ncbi:hypothetical protein M436DRAFT_57838 [Aureobasidium namibiae CBS 147.97]|uniref:RBR-type E3 ubiquitin transferase n=1 Tax=Aureobasidium namibiae CBS 147.97 TaxID=1043004 RepID=A0A074WB03_9PEZI|nr:uncharacterized protein M436DRAFT_57838 [Aureobasidium namibiae CBS 147.97]KEQ68764.1 hypothetical protein M436DRAFT_57838 [Aureobasidium namibiae CBS 147.97]
MERRERTCVVCDDTKHQDEFPSTEEVSSHRHGADVCRDCYINHIEVEIDSKQWNEVACPECMTTLSFHEVKSLTNDESFAKYERACVRATLSADPDFRHCLSATCSSGQLHSGGSGEPIFRCEECGYKHCVVCETNWHEDQTCEEFQATRQLSLNAEDEKSQQEVEKISKPCPQCHVRIEKIGGCDGMTCQ